MRTNTPRTELLSGCILLLVLVLTRSGITRSHFGTELNLPDASWAVFWMIGAFTTLAAWPMLLLVVCVVVDYVVIAGGVSSYCFTPAYPVLIPAYLSLWIAGRRSRQQLPAQTQTLIHLALSILLGVSSCFLISNTGFYLASGYFAHISMMQYAQAVAHYWPYYLIHAIVYCGAGLIVHYIVSHRGAARSAKMHKDR